MGRALHLLKDVQLRKSNMTAGRLSDGGGLYLSISPTGSKSWVFMWTRQGKRREMGLGSYPTVSLVAARKKAGDLRSEIADGRDPMLARLQEREPAFGECADQYIASMEASWRNEKHRAQWRMTLETYCLPLRNQKVSDVDTPAVLSVLQPIWSTKAETASRLRGRIERVLDYAKVKGWRTGENPALWRGHLKNVLPARQRLTRGHHAAMPYELLPGFMQRLPDQAAISARALEFLILTAARSGEVLGAQWNEMDVANAIWTIPAVRMKAGRVHRVPLTDRALAIIADMASVRQSSWVFPGHRNQRPLSETAMPNLMKRMEVPNFTVHGFRSSFRDWAGDETNCSREVAEAALAHSVGDATERAYRRADALEKRRALMDAWGGFLMGRSNEQAMH